jgi:hypothetical protein
MTGTRPPLRIDKDRLPSVFIIGAAKAGTTSLHYYLDQHPQIAMSSVKETNFFTREDYLQALPEYEQYFAGSNDCIRGEASPWYTWYPFLTGDVPERVQSLVPDAKLIYLVRDPVERAVGFFWERFASNHVRSIDTAFADIEDPRNLYVCASKYALQIERYLRVFPEEALLIVDSDDLRERRAETLTSIFTFLEVDPDFSSPRFDDELNAAGGKRRSTRMGQLLKHSAPATAIRRSLPVERRQHLFGPVRRATSRRVRRTPLPEDARRRLEDVLRPDIQRFRQLAGRPFEKWSV